MGLEQESSSSAFGTDSIAVKSSFSTSPSQQALLKQALDLDHGDASHRKAVTFGEEDNVAITENSSSRNTEWHRISTFNQYALRIALIAAISGANFGWEIGGSPATLYFYFDLACEEEDADACTLRDDFLGKYYRYILCTIDLISSVFGAAVLTPLLYDKKGRRFTMIVSAALILFGSILKMASVKVEMYFFFYCFSGAGIAMSNAACTMYLVEIAQVHHRGKIILIWDIGVSLGVWAVILIDIWLKEYIYGWRLTLIGPVLLSIVFIYLVIYRIPESPHWFALLHRHKEAREVLSKIRSDPREVEWELQELTLEVRKMEEQGNKKCTDIVDNRNDKMGNRLLLGCLMQFMNQLSGNNDSVQFAPTIFATVTQNRVASSITNLIIVTMNILTRVAVYFYIDKLGRPLLLMSGSLGMAVGMAMILFIYMVASSTLVSYGDAIFFTFLSVIFQIGFSISWGPIPWLYCAEMFNISTRARCTSLTTGAHFFAKNAINYYFIYTGFYLPPKEAMAFFTVVSALGIPFAYFFIPETAGKTPTEIDESFVKHQPKCLRWDDWGPPKY